VQEALSTSPFSILDFLSGWEYKAYQFSAICQRGARAIETNLNSSGWVGEILLTTNDVFGTITVTPQHLAKTPTISIFPELAKVLGVVSATPGGYLLKYLRPDPLSTFGIFTLLIQAGTEASPFSAPSKVALSLGDLSTQNSALVQAVANVVELTDPSAFMKSLADLPVNKQADLADAIRSLTKTLEAKQ
jgi:hypothetical protein